MANRKRRGAVKSDPTIAIAYLRVSTDVERQALGVEAQRAAIIGWSEKLGIRVAGWFLEQVSGSAPLDRRPILLEAIAAVAAHGAGQLVVQRLDRFSREPLTAALAEAELQRHGASLTVADGAGSGADPTAELIRGILFSVARFEKSMIRARIRAALLVKKTRGELTGAAPFGCHVGSDGKTLEPDAREVEILQRLRELRESGMTIRQLHQEAAARGFHGRTGKPFTVAAIHRMVRAPAPAE